MLISLPSPNAGNFMFLLAIIVFAFGLLGPAFDPDPEAPRPPGQLGSYPGVAGNIGWILHFVGGVGYTVMGLLQFLSPLRRAFPTLHHWSGYLFYFFQIVTICGNMTFMYGLTHHLKGGALSFLFVTVFLNPWWLYCSYRSLDAIRCGNVETHHVFVIRAIAVSAGNYLVPPFDSFLRLALESYAGRESYSVAFWFAFTLAIVVTEIYIQNTHLRASNVPRVILTNESTQPPRVFRDFKNWTAIKLVKKEKCGERWYRLVFSSPHAIQVPAGHHLTLMKPEGEGVLKLLGFRPYSPIRITGNEIEFFVKHYDKGSVSTYLTTVLNEGDSVMACGPFGKFDLVPHPQMLIFAAGTGITPMISILREALITQAWNSTKFKMVFVNGTCLLEDQLQDLKQRFPRSFDYEFISNRAQFNPHLALKSHKPDRSHINGRVETGCKATILICGPRVFTESVIKASWKAGFKDRDIFAFGHTDR